MNLPLTVIEICYTAACMLTKVIYKMLTHKTLLAPPPRNSKSWKIHCW